MISNELFLRFSWPVEILLAFAILGSRAFIVAGGFSIWVHKSSWARRQWIDKKLFLDLSSLKPISLGFAVLFIDSVFAVILIQTGIWKFKTDSNLILFLTTYASLFYGPKSIFITLTDFFIIPNCSRFNAIIIRPCH